MNGRYESYSGLFLPNNFSDAGKRAILSASLRNAALPLYFALVRGTPTLDMTMEDMEEPAIGVNGYARQLVEPSNVGWPEEISRGVNVGLRTRWFTWTAVGGNFSKTVTRLAMVGQPNYLAAEPIYSLSAPLPSELLITPATELVERKFRYEVLM